MEKAEFGVIGLGVMGASLARNVASRGITCVVHNRTLQKRVDFIREYGSEHLIGASDLEKFADRIEAPRKILIMVKAGQVVDTVLKQLTPFLEEGDIVIDGGNSHYRDTIRRVAELSELGIEFVGCGISGGEEGALLGPSLMPGGSYDAWIAIRPVLEAIAAADFSGGPCVAHVGTDGAGHYVKMVHNGIEYGIMQLITEVYDLLQTAYDMEAPQIAGIFKSYTQGKLESYLVEIAAEVLDKQDDLSDGYLVDNIVDQARQKGTGRWTAVESLERGVPTPTLAEAVYSRIISGEKALRTELGSTLGRPDGQDKPNSEKVIPLLEDALYVGMLVCFAQGLHLIQRASTDEGWDIDLGEVVRIWQGGCIIRAHVLQVLQDNYLQGEKGEHLLQMEKIQEIFKDDMPGLRKICQLGLQSGIALSAFQSSLAYVDSMTVESGPAGLIQGLRDKFGAHGYERKDRTGVFHTDWS